MSGTAALELLMRCGVDGLLLTSRKDAIHSPLEAPVVGEEEATQASTSEVVTPSATRWSMQSKAILQCVVRIRLCTSIAFERCPSFS